MKAESFPPIVSPGSRILILGTMPGKKSLEYQQYYAHGGNHFWKIMFGLFDKPFSRNYDQKKELLLNNNIALWDVLKHCYREGSADSAIKEEFPNDFDAFFQSHSGIEQVFFNGKKAAQFFQDYVGPLKGLTSTVLPSTSSANSWYSYEDKVEEWTQILNALKK